MEELLGHKIIRLDTENDGIGELIKAILILDNGKRVTIQVLMDNEDAWLDINID
jgi:hypothetical protein